jgi:hypothetical protein
LTADAEATFTVPLGSAMRGAGLRGTMAEIRLEGDALILTGDQGGRLAIPARDVECIRVASHPGRYRSTGYETRIWRIGTRAPLSIVPMPHALGNYGATMRSFAGWVFADGGKVLRGPSLPVLIVQMTWTVGSVALVAVLLLGGAIVEGLWWMWLIEAFVIGLAILLFVGLRRSYFPRRVSRPDQLDELVPPAEENRR